MIADPNDLSLLVASLRYAYDHTIAEDNSIAAKVVRMRDLESYLRENLLNEVEEILIKYDSFQHFFTVDFDHRFLDKKSENSWKYEIMTANKYNRHERREKKQFLQFKSYVPYNEIVFVIYPLERTYSEITETLTCNIHECLNSYLIPEDQYFIYRDIRNRVNAMIQEVYADIWATAELIGSVKKELANMDEEVVMVIRIPSINFELGSALLDDDNWETSPYNLESLSKHLIKIGMENIEVHPEANRCLFFDPVTKIECRISPDIFLIYERDSMILEYLKLDVRVKLLVAAVEYFTVSHQLKKLFEIPFLSLTSYTIMVLRFLMCGLKNPVIPNLQNPPEDCTSTTCRFNRDNGRILVKMQYEVREFYIKYHDCFRIKNYTTEKYNSVDLVLNKNSETTTWVSRNDSNLGSLLIEFFEFYSIEENYKPVSIINDDGIFLGLEEEEEFINSVVFVQDPFVVEKNIAKTCKKKNLRIIIRYFIAANKALKEGISFEKVCQADTNYSI